MDRVNTGIKGLDEVIQGGFPRERTILVTGGPGSAKTTFAMQFLCAGAREFDEPGIYVTLGESPQNIMENLAGFGLGIEELVKEKKIVFLDLSLLAGSKKVDIDILKNSLATAVKEIGAKRIVIDSITQMVIHLGEDEIRAKLADFSKFSQEFACSTIFISELPLGKQGISVFGVEEFIVDGVIILHNTQKGDVRVRGLEVLKMRGTDHGNRIYPVTFGTSGLEINPEGRVFEDF